jgi:uncharacterized protein
VENQRNPSPEYMTQKQVLFSFYVTQLVVLVTGVFLLWRQGRLLAGYFAFDDIHMWMWGLLVGAGVILLDLFLVRTVRADLLDDGGVNRMLFQGRPLWHILVMAMLAAFSEEILFRGVFQEWLGILGSTLLFVILHTRYLRKWLLTATVAAVSAALGLLTEWTGHLAPAIIAHGLVDFVMGIWIRTYWTKGGNH